MTISIKNSFKLSLCLIVKEVRQACLENGVPPFQYLISTTNLWSNIHQQRINLELMFKTIFGTSENFVQPLLFPSCSHGLKVLYITANISGKNIQK